MWYSFWRKLAWPRLPKFPTRSILLHVTFFFVFPNEEMSLKEICRCRGIEENLMTQLLKGIRAQDFQGCFEQWCQMHSQDFNDLALKWKASLGNLCSGTDREILWLCSKHLTKVIPAFIIYMICVYICMSTCICVCIYVLEMTVYLVIHFSHHSDFAWWF